MSGRRDSSSTRSAPRFWNTEMACVPDSASATTSSSGRLAHSRVRRARIAGSPFTIRVRRRVDLNAAFTSRRIAHAGRIEALPRDSSWRNAVAEMSWKRVEAQVCDSTTLAIGRRCLCAIALLVEVLAGEGTVDPEGGARALGRGDDRQLHVADDVAGD